jgi:hypothetical protein
MSTFGLDQARARLSGNGGNQTEEQTMTRKITSKGSIFAATSLAVLAIAPAAALAQQESVPGAQAAVLGTVNWQIALRPSSGFPRAGGNSQYQTQPGQAEFQAEVEHVTALKGQLVTVSVNGATVGTARVSRLGIAHLERNTDVGQKVPAIHSGSTVSITTSTGALIVSGSY